MSQITVNDLTFYYEGSDHHIFEKVSFSIDTNWKLGFIGRNGKGKTTFLNLLLGKLEYRGTITASVLFDYFPYLLSPEMMERCAADFVEEIRPDCESWKIMCELQKLDADAEILYRPFRTLSHGERTKVMLAILFSRDNAFLLIDEPTDHLDWESREAVKQYLIKKRGFILVSHDRDLLDACIDHVLVLNRYSIEVQSGNFSSWWENKSRKDAFSKMENDKHKKEIRHLKVASRRARQWADKNEDRKIGIDPIKDHDRGCGARPYIGGKTKKMQSRIKQMENRIEREIEEKEGLLKDIEEPVELKLSPLCHKKEVLISLSDYGLGYEKAEKRLFQHLNFTLHRGDRMFLHGGNGCGKSSLIKAILMHMEAMPGGKQIKIEEEGKLETVSGLTVSYIDQDTSFLRGNVSGFCAARDLDESLFCAILRQLGVERIQFMKNMEDFSQGQKKKVLIAASLMTEAHLYIWDEPLNYIDIFSRIQLENLLLKYKPTMLVVEHDVRFREQIATKTVCLKI
ncbi:MAG: ABC-F family ATP-binding cassette domain-containing protein [Lachnospiraceae bacterium]|nr:ABC-F family ATP-binding cassette domain-containing protein [Lachnospiraceae bacterium]